MGGRYRDPCGRRHTAFFPLVALLPVHWELDFGWHEAQDHMKAENRLKELYNQIHGTRPALVDR